MMPGRFYAPILVFAIVALYVAFAMVFGLVVFGSENCPTLREIREAYPHSHPSWHYVDDRRCWYARGHRHEEKQHLDTIKVYGWDEFNEIDAQAGRFDPWQRAEPMFK